MEVGAVRRVYSVAPVLAWAADSTEQAFSPQGDESENFHAEALFDGLDNPAGLAIRPVTEQNARRELFFAESGAGRVLRFSSDDPSSTQEVVTGLATHVVDDATELRVGPWALGFVTPAKLAVLGGMIKSGVEQVGVYLIPESDKPLSAGDVDHVVELFKSEKDSQCNGFTGMTLGETAAYMAIGSVSQGVILKTTLAANRISAPRVVLLNHPETGLRRPVGLCLSPMGRSQYSAGLFHG